MVIYKSELHFRYNLFNKTSYEWRWQFSHYSNIKMKYQYCSKITFIMFWADIARFLQYFRNLSISFINILAILQNFKEIFSKCSLNITVLCRMFQSSPTHLRKSSKFQRKKQTKLFPLIVEGSKHFWSQSKKWISWKLYSGFIP